MKVRDLITTLSAYDPDAEVHLIGLEEPWLVDRNDAVRQMEDAVDDEMDAPEEGETPLDYAQRMAELRSDNYLYIDCSLEPIESEVIEAGGLPVEHVLKEHMGHLINEAVTYVTAELLADWPVRDAIQDATSDRYWGRLDDEWRNSPAIPEALRDADDVWDEFINIVFTRADKAVQAARGAE